MPIENALTVVTLPWLAHCIEVEYQSKAECTKFRNYIADVTCGDQPLERVMQEMMGYVLSDNAKAERAFYFYGPGQNGKSVFAAILIALVGPDNVTSNSLNVFGKQFGLENMVGKLANIAGENNESATKAENLSIYTPIISRTTRSSLWTICPQAASC